MEHHQRQRYLMMIIICGSVYVNESMHKTNNVNDNNEDKNAIIYGFGDIGRSRPWSSARIVVLHSTISEKDRIFCDMDLCAVWGSFGNHRQL